MNKERQVMNWSGDEVGDIERFKSLGSLLQRDGCLKEHTKYRIKCEWVKWREV